MWKRILQRSRSGKFQSRKLHHPQDEAPASSGFLPRITCLLVTKHLGSASPDGPGTSSGRGERDLYLSGKRGYSRDPRMGLGMSDNTLFQLGDTEM